MHEKEKQRRIKCIVNDAQSRIDSRPHNSHATTLALDMLGQMSCHSTPGAMRGNEVCSFCFFPHAYFTGQTISSFMQLHRI